MLSCGPALGGRLPLCPRARRCGAGRERGRCAAQGAWKKTHKAQAEAGSSDSGSDPAAAAAPPPPPQPAEAPAETPASPGGSARPPPAARLRPARRTRKPLRVDNSGAGSPTAPPPLAPAVVTLEAPESSEDTAPPPPEAAEEPEVAMPGRRAGNGGRAGASVCSFALATARLCWRVSCESRERSRVLSTAL